MKAERKILTGRELAINCSLCNDLGYVLDGNMARVCSCWKQQRRIEASGIPLRYQGCTRKSWRGEWPLEEPWLGKPGEDPWLLAILGPVTGVGKTHIATAVFRELVEAGAEGSWIAVRPALQILQSAIQGSEEQRLSAAVLRERLLAPHLVLLDDVGRERGTPYEVDQLAFVLEYRHAWLLPTIITGNAEDLSSFERSLGPRVGSRLAQGSVVCILGGEDRRLGQ